MIPGAADLLSPAGFLPAPPNPQDATPTLLLTLDEFTTFSNLFEALETARANLVEQLEERKADAKSYQRIR